MEENGSALRPALNFQLSTINFPGRQADISWLHLSRKQDRHCRGRSITDVFRHFSTINQRKPMRSTIRYQSQLLLRRSYKPNQVIRIRPIRRLNLVFRPVNRFGAKPQLTIVS